MRVCGAVGSLFFILILTSRLVFAQGGPPLLTDDPGTPGDNHWEINLAMQLDQFKKTEILSAPYVDANYGWGEAVQLKAEGGWVSDSGGISTGSGGTALLIGVKWRFFDDEKSGLSISTYPQVQFHTFLTSSKSELVDPGTHYILPIEISRTFGKWTINPELGLIHSTENIDTAFYGLAVGYTVKEFREILFEFYSQKDLDPDSEKSLLFNVGTRWLLSDGVSFIASVGHTLETFSNDSPQLLAYAGIQLRY